jgi:hypothetical protein
MRMMTAYKMHRLMPLLTALSFALTLSACGGMGASMSGSWRAITVTPTSSPTPAPAKTPPAATPGSAELLIDSPYISGITPRAHEIFAVGQSMGNRANIFSKVGDSITASDVFLEPFSEGNYNLRDHAYLQPVID